MATELQLEIQQLEREKQELERQNREKQEFERQNRERQLLEQKRRELRGIVSSLRSGVSPNASASNEGPNRSPVVTSPLDTAYDDHAGEEDRSRYNISSALQESRDNLSYLHSQHLASTSTPASTRTARGHKVSSRNKQVSLETSSESEEEEDVMSDRHKQAIQANRDVLVENMLPDDIFNDLISRKILSTADVSRIKEKNTREAINEELLNILCRRSDRAFHVFVISLRKTLQEYLANRIDPPSSSRSSKKKRKRQTGEVNINVDCEGVEPISAPRHGSRQRAGYMDRQKSNGMCSCQEVEEQILLMAKEAYRNIRRRDHTPAAFEQFRKELQQTNAVVKDSMEIMHTLKILCRHGDITGISEGSIILTLRCYSAMDAEALWDMYASGRLQSLIRKGFVTQALRKRCGVRKICLKVWMAENELLCCIQELGGRENQYRLPAHTIAKTSRVLHKRRRRLENKPCRTDIAKKPFCGHQNVTLQPNVHCRPQPRQAFQEIISNQSHAQCVPTKSKGPDFCTRPTTPLPLPIFSPGLKNQGQLQYNLRLRPTVVYR